jgi:hypothetical protein
MAVATQKCDKYASLSLFERDGSALNREGRDKSQRHALQSDAALLPLDGAVQESTFTGTQVEQDARSRSQGSVSDQTEVNVTTFLPPFTFTQGSSLQQRRDRLQRFDVIADGLQDH